MSEQTATGVHLSQHERREAELRISDGKIEIVRCEVRERDASFQSPAGDGRSDVIASMPGVDVFHRCWVFPGVEAGLLEGMLLNRLEADLPVPVEELTWGYRKTKVIEAGKESWRVCVQAARSKRVAQHLLSLASAGIEADVLTTEAEAIGAFYRYGIEHSEGSGTDVLILAVGGEWLVAVIGDGIVKSLRKLRQEGKSDRFMLQECRHAIEEELSAGVRQVFWDAGDDLAISVEEVRERIHASVTAMELSERIVNGESVSPESVVSIGLAMAGLYERDEIIRLAGKKEVQETAKYPRLMKLISHPIRWSIAAAVMLVLAGTIHLWAIGWENREMQSLLDEADTAKLEASTLEPKMQAYGRLEAYRIDVEGVLVDICRAMPDNIVISSIQLSREKKLLIRGTAKDPKAVFGFADTLRKSHRLSEVQPEQTEPGRGGGFTVSAELVGVKSLNALSGRGIQWK
jgi:hypothetical protein